MHCGELLELIIRSDVGKARVIFDKATKVGFKNVEDLASVWCEYGEMELRHELVIMIKH